MRQYRQAASRCARVDRVELTSSRMRDHSHPAVSVPFSVEMVPVAEALNLLFRDVDEVEVILTQWPTGELGDEQTDWILLLSSPSMNVDEVSFGYEILETVTTPLDDSVGVRRRRLEGNTPAVSYYPCPKGIQRCSQIYTLGYTIW